MSLPEIGSNWKQGYDHIFMKLKIAWQTYVSSLTAAALLFLFGLKYNHGLKLNSNTISPCSHKYKAMKNHMKIYVSLTSEYEEPLRGKYAALVEVMGTDVPSLSSTRHQMLLAADRVNKHVPARQ